MVINAALDALRRAWMEERMQNAPLKCLAIGFVPASHSKAHAISFDELSGAEDDDREEGSTQERDLLSNFHTRWVDVLERECASCKQERSRRKRVLDDTETSLADKFALAPLITAMTKPEYLTSQQRAKLFAQFNRTQVLWIQADDFPLSGETATYSEEKLIQRRQDFLRKHDQSTGGIMGLFPMVYNLPVTFTATVDKKRKIFKFTEGHIVTEKLPC